MVSQVSFNGKGYISKTDTVFKPKKGVSEKEWNEIGERCHWRGRDIDKITTSRQVKINKHLQKYLLNRNFTFAPDKVNIIFGPNGSGKSTIIKAIASYAMCGTPDYFDGFTNLAVQSPIELFSFFDRKEMSTEQILSKIKDNFAKRAGNEAELVWDGQPVYYENFSNRKSYELGDMCGTLLNGIVEEATFYMQNGKRSSGENSMWILNKLLNILSKTDKMDIEKMIDEHKTAIEKANDVWAAAYRGTLQYFMNIYNPNAEEKRMTILLDEIDKSMDISNIIALYYDFLPAVVSKKPIQVIAVSHSPLILTNEIFNNPSYNIISIDEKYTNKCRKNLFNFSFK